MKEILPDESEESWLNELRNAARQTRGSRNVFLCGSECLSKRSKKLLAELYEEVFIKDAITDRWRDSEEVVDGIVLCRPCATKWTRFSLGRYDQDVDGETCALCNRSMWLGVFSDWDDRPERNR